MTLAGYSSGNTSARSWYVYSSSIVYDYSVWYTYNLRPVINLNNNVEITKGSDSYVIKTH